MMSRARESIFPSSLHRYRWHARESLEYRWLDADPCYDALGSSAEERALQYCEFVPNAIPQGEWTLIREALQHGQLAGGE